MNNWIRIAEIAVALQPAQQAYDDVWDNADDFEMEELKNSVDTFNAAIEPFIPEIATLSNNSASTFRIPPNRYAIWLGREDFVGALEDLAMYESWNKNYCDKQREIEHKET